MAFNFKNLEEFFNKSNKNITFQRTNTQPLSSMTPQPVAGTFGRNIEYSTQEPNKPLGSTPGKSTLPVVNPMQPTPIKPAAILNSPFGQTPEKSTIAPISPFGQTPEKSTAVIRPMPSITEKEGALLNLYAGLATSDRKPTFANPAGGPRIGNVTVDTGFIGISGAPGEPMRFTFDETKGQSSHNWTRLQYNNQYRMTQADSGDMVPQAALKKKSGIAEDIDSFYKKVGKNDFVSLRDEAQRNNPRAPLFMKSPFVQRGIQRGKDNPAGPLEMINDLTAPVIDTARIAKYMISPDGLLFNIKQFGLQLTNPKNQFFQLGIPNANRIYNPLALAAQVPLNQLGIHVDRHNLGPLNPREITYERVVQNIEQVDPSNPGSQNRLVQLGKDMKVGLFEGRQEDAVQKRKGLENLFTKFRELLAKIRGKGELIPRLSGVNGPHSLFGIGQTSIYKHTSGIQKDVAQIYTPEKPYNKSKATTHYEPGYISEASKGDDPKDTALEILTYKGNYGNEPYESDTPDGKGFPKSEGPIDASGIRPGEFKTLDYNQLYEFARAPKTFRDFRKGQDDTYEKNSISRISLSDYGATKPGESEDDTNYDKDYVKIRINDIAMRAYITDMTDKLSPTYASITYAGNPVESYMFDKISREWSLSLTVPAFTKGELKNNYKILNDLMKTVSPKLYGGVAGGQINKITVGALWINIPTIIDNFDYKINFDAGWDIALGEDNETAGFELPMLFDVTMGGKFIVNHDGEIWTDKGNFFNEEIWA